MKIIVIGATGTIGVAVADALEANHEIVRASRNGPVQVDLADPSSIAARFESVNGADGVVCCAASVKLAALASLPDQDFLLGLKSKLLGQVSLTRHGLGRLRDGGSITLTSGRFEHPVPGSTAGALANAGLEAFVRSAALEMPRGLRINVVSPGWVKETLENLGMDSASGTAARDVARVYVAAVEGTMQGQVIFPTALRAENL